jgi:hypothetical protein
MVYSAEYTECQAFCPVVRIGPPLGPKGKTHFARCHFRVQKFLDFNDPPLPMALEMDFPALK